MARRRILGTVFAVLGAVACASCVAGGSNTPISAGMAPLPPDTSAAQPRMASYSCADGGMITIENRGSSVRIVEPDGGGAELPAAPANQRSRYGLASDAIVLDGREALLMKGGEPPLTCTRS